MYTMCTRDLDNDFSNLNLDKYIFEAKTHNNNYTDLHLLFRT